MSRFFEDLIAARTLYNLKTSDVDCSKHKRLSKGLKCICWKCYTYVSMEKEEEDKIRRKMLTFLISYFYKILSSKYKIIPEDIKLKIPSFSQKVEFDIYNSNTLLESYMHYFDHQFLKIMLSDYPK